MDDRKQVTQKRSPAFVVSVIFNTLLFVSFMAVLVLLGYLKYECNNFSKIIISNKHTGLILISMTEEGLRGQSKQEVVDLLESIYKMYPVFLSYKSPMILNRNNITESDCVSYAGTYLVFRDAKFAFFDTDLKCDFYRAGDRFYNEDLIRE